MGYLFYLDGVEYDNPQEDRDLVTSIKRNANLNGLLVTQDVNLDFIGDAYDYLYASFHDSLCNEVECEIYEECGDEVEFVYSGIIKITAMKIEEQECRIRTKIQDNSFYSYINNNKNIEVPLGVETLSKSGEIIDYLELYEAGFFHCNVAGPTIYTPAIKGWRVFDIMQFLLDYMTDGRVELQSDLLTGQTDDINELFLTQGQSMKLPLPAPGTGDNNEIKMSFKDIYEIVQKLYNCSFRIIDADGYNRAIMIIEHESYFFSTESSYSFTDVKDLQISALTKNIYSSIKFGTSEHTSVTKPPAIVSTVEFPLYGWEDEQYHLFGQCNQDKELSLEVKVQAASNVIEDVFSGASPDWDDSKFIVEIDNVDTGALTCDAVAYDFYGQPSPPFYYNLGINNANILNRRSEFLHNSVQDYLGQRTSQFHVTRNQNTYNSTDANICVSQLFNPTTTCPSTANVFQPYEYDNDTNVGNFNNGGNYDTATFQYTCPADGSYTFNHTAFFTTFGIQQHPLVPSKIQIVVSFENVTKGTIITNSATAYSNVTGVVSATSPIFCDTNDVVEARIKLNFNRGDSTVTQKFGIVIANNSYFECTSAPQISGVLSSSDTDSFRAILYKFDYPIAQSDFRDIVDDPTKLFTFTSNNITRKAWLNDVKYNHFTNKAQLTLVANNAINQNT